MTLRRAILSVYEKSNVIELATFLVETNWQLVASGGTAQLLAETGLPVTTVETVTTAPEILGGRVKTLHPAIHGGILARDLEQDKAELAREGIQPFELVVCNLYPFTETIAREGSTFADAIEQIDIGGVTLLRAAAKNHARVTVVSDPSDYGLIMKNLEEDGIIQANIRAKLAVKAFEMTRDYDTAIADYLKSHVTE